MMAEQPTQLDVFGGAKTIGRSAPRQDAVLELLAQHDDGIGVDEAGAAAHASAGKHSIDESCAWCAIDGRDIIRALKRKDAVEKSSVVGKWVLKREPSKSDGAFGEFPEGF